MDKSKRKMYLISSSFDEVRNKWNLIVWEVLKTEGN